METKNLKGKTVAILTDTGFEEIELTSPKKALEAAGATVAIVSRQKSVKAWKHDHWTEEYKVDRKLEEVSSNDFDALMIPGGVINPDEMRRHDEYVNFAASFIKEGKPVAAICHGPQLLIETKMIRNRNLTSFPSVKTDLENAGANWIDKEVVVDNGLVTSRSPDDLGAFNKKMVEEFAEGIHAAFKK